MSVSIYDFEEVKRRVSCVRYLADRGIEVNSAGRCAAVWRGGKGMNVHVEDDKWFDFKTEQGGSVLDLCAVVENVGDLTDAARILGDRYHLEPKRRTRKAPPPVSRSQMLLNTGFALDATYPYTDADGKPVYFVDRYRWPNPFIDPPKSFSRKEFVQRTPEHEGLDPETPHLLYRLPEVVAAKEVFVVEGEKDVETLRAWGFVATTNSGGASKNGSRKWPMELNGCFAGKDVVIIGDNDDKGAEHAQNLVAMLRPVAASVRSLVVSALPKGDVTDWKEKEGGTPERLRELVAALPVPVSPSLHAVAVNAPTPEEIAAAKIANETALANYVSIGGTSSRRRIAPVRILDIVKDVHTRFLSFPRRLGGSVLFDHDRDTGAINQLKTEYDLFSWMQEKSGHPIDWESGARFTSRRELHSSLLRNSISYERISDVPDWPMRKDVYYTFRDALVPTPGHAAFNAFIDRFCPDGAANRVLLCAFVLSIMYYRSNVPRPCWIIDSTNGQAAGKTTLVDMIAELYRFRPIRVYPRDMECRPDEIYKRLVSVTGRNSRIFLADNVQGEFRSPFFADLVTAPYISGRAPYGEGEEARPNDLTYVITSNAARVDSDISSRAYTIKMRNPSRFDKAWRMETLSLIERSRYSILADGIDILSNSAPPPQDWRPATRTPEFETEVLWRASGGEKAYASAVAQILAARSEINVENEKTTLVVEAIEMRIDEFLKREAAHTNNATPVSHDMVAVWIRSAVVDFWLKRQYKVDLQILRNMVDSGKTDRFMKGLKIYPTSSRADGRSSGILYVGKDVEYPYIPILNMNTEKDVGLVNGVGWHFDAELVASLRRTPSAPPQPAEIEDAELLPM